MAKDNDVDLRTVEIKKPINFLAYYLIYFPNAYKMAFVYYFPIKFASLTIIKSVHLAWE